MSDNAKGSLFMVFAMTAFGFEDMFIKAAAEVMPLGFVLALFGIGGTLLFCLMALKMGQGILVPAILSKPILIRAVCEIIGRISFAFAITHTTLSSASAILQATPLVVALGAAIFFNEKVGLKRWIAISIGFGGVLLIIKPSLSDFDALSLFAIVATLGFAGRDLATRAVSSAISNIQLGVYGFFVLIPSGVFLMLYNGNSVEFDTTASVQVLGAVTVGVVAYHALTLAMRTGEMSVVSPFRYSRLLVALAIGVTVFGERPDLLTILGSTLIVLSGAYFLIKKKETS